MQRARECAQEIRAGQEVLEHSMFVFPGQSELKF